MYVDRTFRNLLLVIWIIEDIIDLFVLSQELMTVGPALLLDPLVIIVLSTIVLSLLMAVFLLIDRINVFVILFGVYVGIEVFLNLQAAPYVMFGIFSNPDWFIEVPTGEIVDTLTSNIAIPVTLLIYIIFYVIMLVYYFKDNSKKYKFIKYARNTAIVLAIFELVVTIMPFTLYQESFEFIDIFFEMMKSLLYSAIYIIVPTYLYQRFYR